MEVILLEHVEKLGKMGDKVSVKNGYARNYLLPQKKACKSKKYVYIGACPLPDFEPKIRLYINRLSHEPFVELSIRRYKIWQIMKAL